MTQNTVEQSQSVVPREYKAFLKGIKERILSSQVKAAIAVNRELITLYWEIGTTVYQSKKARDGALKQLKSSLKT